MRNGFSNQQWLAGAFVASAHASAEALPARAMVASGVVDVPAQRAIACRIHFVRLRRESWELLSDGIRRNDESSVEAFKQKSAEANVAMEGIKVWVENANKGKGRSP